MRPGERARVRFVFGALGAVPVFLAGWLAWVQVAQAGELPRSDRVPLRLVAETADRQSQRREAVPAPRGTIVDRNGSVLALDCKAYDVRARITVPRDAAATVSSYLAYLAEVAGDLANALVADPDLADRGAAKQEHLRNLGVVLAREFATHLLPAEGAVPKDHPRTADVRVAGGVDVLSVVEALRVLDERRKLVTMDFLRSHRRVYRERELTYGLVGHVDTAWQTAPGESQPTLRTFGVCGLESWRVLEPGAAAGRDFLKDGKGRPYFKAPIEGASAPTVLHTTIDVDLQRAATRHLATTAEEGTRDGRVPKWAALVLVEVATGDVLAAASWHRDERHLQAAAFTPYQSLYEPGSIVKPLVFAYALESGVVDWSHEYDCAQGSSDYRQIIAPLGRRRPVSDDHACGLLTPHGILVNSSNIGASYVGLKLDREQWRAYLRFYGFGESLGLDLPHEPRASVNPRSFVRSFDPQTSLRSFRANTAISYSFGYELQVTAMQMARAYLRLVRGSGAELRLCRGVEIDGQWHAAPQPAERGARFRGEVVEAVRAAMVDVVSSDPKATGSFLHNRVLKDMGIDLHGMVAGKTGTAASHVTIAGRGKVEVRNASFVGFLPAEAPRWLAVCVLQKDDGAHFYGGSYAGPPAVRLLLQAQKLEERRQLRQESQGGPDGQVRSTSGSPGDSGWSRGAPEKTSVGR